MVYFLPKSSTKFATMIPNKTNAIDSIQVMAGKILKFPLEVLLECT